MFSRRTLPETVVQPLKEVGQLPHQGRIFQ